MGITGEEAEPLLRADPRKRNSLGEEPGFTDFPGLQGWDNYPFIQDIFKSFEDEKAFRMVCSSLRLLSLGTLPGAYGSH